MNSANRQLRKNLEQLFVLLLHTHPKVPGVLIFPMSEVFMTIGKHSGFSLMLINISPLVPDVH